MADTTQLNRKTREVAVLAQVAELLTSLDLDNVLARTLHVLTEAVGAERGSFWLVDEHGQATQRIITRRNLPPERSSAVVGTVLERGLAGWVFRNKQAAIVNDTLTDERWVVFPDDPAIARSALCVPFMFDGRINGIMTLEHSNPNNFLQDDLLLATTVANQATIAIRNAQLFDLVETQERRLRAVLQSTAEPLLTIGQQGRVQLVNSAALRMLGALEEQIIGSTLMELSLFNPIFAEVARQIEDGVERFELRDETRGTDYAVQSSSWRGNEATLGRVIVFNDITSLKDLNRLKSQMIQMASHDLKNPLGVILSYTEILKDDLGINHNDYPLIENIARVAERMLNMVTELLDLERIEATPGSQNRPFSPAHLLDEVLPEIEAKVAQKRQSLLRKIDPVLPDLLGEPAQIREAFRNLLDNASKYTPEGGLIIVRASADQDRFHFSVEDTGFGIPENLQANLFQRFYRAKQPGTEEISGTGLGLSLVKAIVERHGGRVWFRSKPEEGSTFGFWLPLPEE